MNPPLTSKSMPMSTCRPVQKALCDSAPDLGRLGAVQLYLGWFGSVRHDRYQPSMVAGFRGLIGSFSVWNVPPVQDAVPQGVHYLAWLKMRGVPEQRSMISLSLLLFVH